MGREQQHPGKCLNCKQEKPLWSDGLCSQRCRNEYERNLGYSVCRNCGKHIPKPKRGPKRDYCDRNCEREYKRKIQQVDLVAAARGGDKEAIRVLDMQKRSRLQSEIREQASARHDDDGSAMREYDKAMQEPQNPIRNGSDER